MSKRLCRAGAAILSIAVSSALPVAAARDAPAFERCQPKPVAADRPPILLTLRATSALSDEAIRWIAHYSTTVPVPVDWGAPPDDWVLSVCGHFSDAYWNELTQRPGNEGLTRQPPREMRLMQMPGCAYWKNDVKVSIAPGETLDEVLEREIGITSATSALARCTEELRKANRGNRCDKSLYDLVQKRNPGRDLEKLGSKPLVLPLITRFVTISIRPECFSDAAAAIAAFDKVAHGTPGGGGGGGAGSFAGDPEPDEVEIGRSPASSGSAPAPPGGDPGRPSSGEKPPPPAPPGDTPSALPAGPPPRPGEDISATTVFPEGATGSEAAPGFAPPISRPAPPDSAPQPDPAPPVVARAPAELMELNLPQLDKIKTPACLNAATVAGRSWPFDAAAVADQYKISLKLAGGTSSRPIIAIVDTGLSLKDRIVAMRELGVRRKDRCSASLDREDCYVGGTFNKGADFGVSCDYGLRWHGSQVADLALGGAAFRKVFGADLPLRIAPYRVVRRDGGKTPVISSHTDVSNLIIDTLDEKEDSRPTIYNISLGTRAHMKSLADVPALTYKKPLLVVAAGNNREHDNTLLYPARYGGTGKLRDHLISVAAHDADGKLAEDFSAWDPNKVDIAAPGCQLQWPLNEPDRQAICATPQPNDGQPLYGTSFAAPLVAFTAALLQSLGMEDAAEIKSRILIAAHHDMGDRTRLGSRLDIVRAITLFEDQVILKKEGQRLVGTLNIPAAGLCGGEVRREDHVHLAPLPGDPGKLGALEMDENDPKVVERKAPCEAGSAPITFRPREGGELHLNWADISEVVTRYKAPAAATPSPTP